MRINLESAILRNGGSEPVALPMSGVTVIVGPNNAGKSRLLGELYGATVSPAGWQGGDWVAQVHSARPLEEEVFRAWFESAARMHSGGYPALWDDGNEFNPINYATAWSQWSIGSGPAQAFRSVGYFTTDSRFQMLNPSTRPEPRSRNLEPIQNLWLSRATELRLSNLTEAAFGFPVCIDPHKNILELLIGAPSEVEEARNPERAALERYDAMVQVATQGDGIRAFTGLLLNAIATDKSVLFVDEPEAFLHPPQARLMGQYLVDETPGDGQVFIATHSTDVLEGVLDSRSGREVAIIRLDAQQGQQGTVRTRHQLDPGALASLWNDSLVRYSGILAGLFHKGVVLCEGDGDCRYYSATLDQYLSGGRAHDLAFAHVGGKSSMPRAISALRELGVRTLAIVDIDLLNNGDSVKKTVEAAGGNFAPLSADVGTIQEFVRSRDGGPMVRDLKDAAAKVMRRKPGSSITDEESSRIIASVKQKSGWKVVKENGISSFRGEARDAAVRVREALLGMGILLVPVGELESWHPEINAPHGRSFVTAVFERDAHLHAHQQRDGFMREIAGYFGLVK